MDILRFLMGRHASNDPHVGDRVPRLTCPVTMFLFSRRYLLPWLISAIVMFGLSYLWHGLLLRDLQELKVPLGLYLGLSGLVYLVVGLVITVLVHEAIRHE